MKIVLPCANEGAWLRVTVDSILDRTDYPAYEIVVSANGDTRTDLSFLDGARYRERVRLISSKEFLGVANARNAGVSPDDAEYYVFLDAHSLIEREEWLRRAVATLKEHPQASMMQPEIQNFIYEEEVRPDRPFDPARLRPYCFEYAVRWAWPYEDPYLLTQMVGRAGSPEPHEEMSGSGGATFTRAATFHRLGGFDRDTSGWFHETLDFCIRGWLHGHPMIVDPTIRIHHRTKLQRTNPERPSDLYHGFLRTAYKYLSPRRRDMAEAFCWKYLPREAEAVIQRVRNGGWLDERARHLRERAHDDDWLFARFEVYEERFGS